MSARPEAPADPADAAWRAPTAIIDSDHPEVRRLAVETAADAATDTERAIRIFLWARDAVRYDPYGPFYRPEHYRASNVMAAGRGFCINKAALLCALGRALGIPSRLGFATVRNHLATRQLIDFLGTDLFVFHGYAEFFLNSKWVKATPAFNAALCRRHGVAPLEFNGVDDAVFQAFNEQRRRFMTYVAYHGVYADAPVEEILEAWRRTYGADRIAAWISELERSGGQSIRRFSEETVIR